MAAEPKRRFPGHGAEGLPVRVKPLLMGMPWPLWKRVVYPLWRRWYQRWLTNPRVWRYGDYKPGDQVRWRGVRLVCCTDHYVGHAADHPWDPAWGWPAWRANALWEPARAIDRLLLRVIGDPRRAAPSSTTNGGGDGD